VSDLLVRAPEALDVGELEAEREQRGEVLVEGFLVERVLGEGLLFVAHRKTRTGSARGGCKSTPQQL
jgi:hypothetical protein